MTHKFGPTGKFPEGKLNQADEGELQLGITHDAGNVIIDFGTQVTWIGLPPSKAIEFANMIIQHANALKDKNN